MYNIHCCKNTNNCRSTMPRSKWNREIPESVAEFLRPPDGRASRMILKMSYNFFFSFLRSPQKFIRRRHFICALKPLVKCFFSLMLSVLLPNLYAQLPVRFLWRPNDRREIPTTTAAFLSENPNSAVQRPQNSPAAGKSLLGTEIRGRTVFPANVSETLGITSPSSVCLFVCPPVCLFFLFHVFSVTLFHFAITADLLMLFKWNTMHG